MVPLYKRYFYISEFIKKATHCILSLSKPVMEEKLINLLINITLRRSRLLDKEILPDYFVPSK